jgi:eukaryotic-like serine/threonine-protein kinase
VESEQTLVRESSREPSLREEPRRLTPRGPTSAAPAGGGLLLGRYRLLERLGAGGFGVVWRARDELLHRDVALKRIPLGPDGDRERATREALAAARLAHPAIVALYEACVVEDACCLISELVQGCTLAQLIAAGESSDEELLEVGLALAEALAHAHERGVVHRDIKPQNVLIPTHARDAGALAKLTDFGGASLVGEDALTRTGDVLGTLAYMAPEQCEGLEVGEEADLYSLALVLYEALSGVNPVRGPTPASTARRIGSELPPLRRRRPELPRVLGEALDTALAPDPRDRGTLAELRSSLEEALDRGLPARRRRLSPRAPAGERDVARLAGPHDRREHDRDEHGQGEYGQGAYEQVGPHDRQAALEERPAARARRLALPRALWLAGAALLCAWQAAAGRPGVALIILALLAPVLAVPLPGRRRRLGLGWLGCALAPALGVVGLAGAFPALAGQPRRWRDRAVLGALGYWWLVLAEPLVGRTLWRGSPSPLPARSAWEGSLSVSALHLLGPLLSLGTLLGALLWAAGALVLPVLVRGSSAVLDAAAVALWSAALVLAAPALDSGLAAHGGGAGRGAVLGAILGALLALAVRALRGPV